MNYYKRKENHGEWKFVGKEQKKQEKMEKISLKKDDHPHGWVVKNDKGGQRSSQKGGYKGTSQGFAMPSEGIAKPKGPMEATSKGGQRSSLWGGTKVPPNQKAQWRPQKCKGGLFGALPTGPNLGPEALQGLKTEGGSKNASLQIYTSLGWVLLPLLLCDSVQ